MKFVIESFMRKLSVETSLILIILASSSIISSCSLNSLSAQNLSQNSSGKNTYNKANSDVSRPENKTEPEKFPPVLIGGLNFADAEKSNQTTISVITNGETIQETVNRGFQVNLPQIGTETEMDMMNCSGYLGTAKVTYQGLKHEAWTAELINTSKPSDLKQRMLQCVGDPNDAATKKFLTDPKYLSNSIFLLAPTDKKRGQIQFTKKPNWNEVFERIPYEWLKTADLPRQNANKERLKICIGGWTDSDGDGKIDIIVLCAVNEESGYEYYRTLQLVNNNWKELWQTVDSKN